MKVILATNNAHKVKEIREILGDKLGQTLTLKEAGVTADPEENGSAFVENALIKAREICRITSLPALSDDSGLCVDALGGAPGVYSARYSGGDSKDNISLLLKNLQKAEESIREFESAVNRNGSDKEYAPAIEFFNAMLASGKGEYENAANALCKILGLAEGEEGIPYKFTEICGDECSFDIVFSFSLVACNILIRFC